MARVESGRLELNAEPFDLGRAVREAGQLYEAQASEKGLQFFVEIAPEVDGWIEGEANADIMFARTYQRKRARLLDPEFLESLLKVWDAPVRDVGSHGIVGRRVARRCRSSWIRRRHRAIERTGPFGSYRARRSHRLGQFDVLHSIGHRRGHRAVR